MIEGGPRACEVVVEDEDELTNKKIDTNLAVCEHGGVVALEEAVHQWRHALVEHVHRWRAGAPVHMVEGEGVAADLDLQDGNSAK